MNNTFSKCLRGKSDKSSISLKNGIFTPLGDNHFSPEMKQITHIDNQTAEFSYIHKITYTLKEKHQ